MFEVMKVKLFTTSTSWGKPARQLEELEETINSWLAAHPDASVDHVHRLSQPTFGWGQLSIALWYTDSDETTTG